MKEKQYVFRVMGPIPELLPSKNHSDILLDYFEEIRKSIRWIEVTYEGGKNIFDQMMLRVEEIESVGEKAYVYFDVIDHEEVVAPIEAAEYVENGDEALGMICFWLSFDVVE